MTTSFWADKNVLVTGATGFVGSWITSTLADGGGRVIALVRDRKPASRFFKGGVAERADLVFGDVTDRTLLERTLAGYEVNVVIHLAAEAIVGAAQKSPIGAFETNVAGTWSLLEACRSVGVEGVVVASSDKAYGHHEQLPYAENFALKPKHPYEVSKACTDLIAQCYAQSYGLPVAITRCANIYGGGDLNWSRIVPSVVKAVLFGQRPIIRSDGTPVRDYMHVEDVVNAYLTLAQAVVTKKEVRGEAFNFGSEKPVSVLELTNRIIAMSEHPTITPDVQGIGKPLKEIQAQYVGSAKASQRLDWRPLLSLDEGISRTLAWYRNYFER